MSAASADDGRDQPSDVLSTRRAAQPSLGAWKSEPAPRDVVAQSLLAFVVFALFVLTFDDWVARVPLFGDNKSYIEIATAIRRWDFHDIQPYHFWGYPYLIAVLSLLTGLSETWALLIVSVGSALVAAWLLTLLWGGWVAAWFVILSIEWQQRAVLGGAEPLFMALLCGAFVMARRFEWFTATLLAAFATTVRPVGLFALVGIGVALLMQRKFRLAIAMTIVGLGIGVLYVIPFELYFRDPLANARFYQELDWPGGSPLSVPMLPLIRGYLVMDLPATTVARQGFWVLLFLTASVTMAVRRDFRSYARKHLPEAVFVVCHVLFLFSYNSSVWAWADFARYSLPAAPIALFALRDGLPRDRRLIWMGTVASAVLAAASGVGARRVLGAAISRLRG